VTRIELRCAGRCHGLYGSVAGDLAELWRGLVYPPNIISAKYDDGLVTFTHSIPKGRYERGPADTIPARVQLLCPSCGAGPWVTWADVLAAIRRQPRRTVIVIHTDGAVAR
jgi:hypothetical protein